MYELFESNRILYKCKRIDMSEIYINTTLLPWAPVEVVIHQQRFITGFKRLVKGLEINNESQQYILQMN